MNVCATCGRHLKCKGHYCGTACKAASILTASDARKLAKRERYVAARQFQRPPPIHPGDAHANATP